MALLTLYKLIIPPHTHTHLPFSSSKLLGFAFFSYNSRPSVWLWSLSEWLLHVTFSGWLLLHPQPSHLSPQSYPIANSILLFINLSFSKAQPLWGGLSVSPDFFWMLSLAFYTQVITCRERYRPCSLTDPRLILLVMQNLALSSWPPPHLLWLNSSLNFTLWDIPMILSCSEQHPGMGIFPSPLWSYTGSGTCNSLVPLPSSSSCKAESFYGREPMAYSLHLSGAYQSARYEEEMKFPFPSDVDIP